MKAYTDIEQSKKLAEILPIESADMHYTVVGDAVIGDYQTGISNARSVAKAWKKNPEEFVKKVIPCWSLAALLSLIKDKCGYFEFVYLKRTCDGRANPLEDVYRLSTDVYDVYNKEAIDACYVMILKLHELNLL